MGGERKEVWGEQRKRFFQKIRQAPFPSFEIPQYPSVREGRTQNRRLKTPTPGPTFLRLIVATKSNASAAQAPAFEDAMQRLETIVEAMESGETPLAELLAKFEEGSKLLGICEQRLQAAELRIEQLKRAKDGSPLLETFASIARPEPDQA
jgi:exodeoxyribonuclease VII small subunit